MTVKSVSGRFDPGGGHVSDSLRIGLTLTLMLAAVAVFPWTPVDQGDASEVLVISRVSISILLALAAVGVTSLRE